MSGLIRWEVYARRSERPNDIADRQHSDKRLAINHRQMTDSVAAHEIHALANGVARTHADDVLGHEVLDENVPGRETFQYSLSDVVALGEDAYQIRATRHR